MAIISTLAFIFGIGYLIYISRFKPKDQAVIAESEIDIILNNDIEFYQKIQSPTLKQNFRNRAIRFINHVTFTPVGPTTRCTLKDKVMIATSAFIPLYAFPDWEYQNIQEILLYEDNFDQNFKVNEDHHIMGMVGDGAMNNTMALSLKALHEGFQHNDGLNTSIHEFIHLIDKADGSVDGVPEYLIPKELIQPWLQHIRAVIQEIKAGDSEINPYAATNEAEFFAVISEYFFEKPAFLARNQPELFQMLQRIFVRNNV